MKIGILYICTGNYVMFWEDFYKSFTKYFCTNHSVNYLVFTDKDIPQSNDVKVFNIQNQPWPLITLLRFETFLSIEDELKKYDYLYFFNSNLKCVSEVLDSDIIPTNEEKLVFYHHAGYIYSKKYMFPYERNKKSTAYIPYNCGNIYVGGALIGGETQSFLQMCRTLKQNIETDLKQNFIPKWHDESHINHYCCLQQNYKLLNPSFCYPVGFDLPFEKKIVGVSKQDKFDVQSFKFVTKQLSFIQKIVKLLDERYFPYLRYIISVIKRERI